MTLVIDDRHAAPNGRRVAPVDHPPLGFSEELLEGAGIGIDAGPHGYQRALSEAKLKALYPYDVSLGGTLAVNRRSDDTLWCFDGQHRLEAARRSGYTHVPCRVFALTREREARYFIECNWATLAVSARDKFRALVVAGDERACAIKAVIEECGFAVEYDTRTPPPDALVAVETASALCRSRVHARGFDTAPLRAALLLIHRTWPGQRGNVSGFMLRAVDGVCRKAGPRLDAERFGEQLFVYTPALLTRAGGLMAKAHNIPLWQGMAQKMIEELNAKLPGASRRVIPGFV